MKNNNRKLDGFISLETDINDALKLIVNSNESEITTDYHQILDLMDNDSLFEKCARIVKDASEAKKKPTIRILSHFACTGGTLISKCIAAQANTYVLSEVHPTTDLHIKGRSSFYSPRDISTLSDWANVPNIKSLQSQLFIENITIANRHVNSIGGALVLREHSHADFCVGKSFHGYSLVDKMLGNKFSVLKVASVRNPIESYISLLDNGWLHFEPSSFDEYCKRYLSFINNFDKKQIVKYENFVLDPINTMKYICRLLELSFNESFIDIYDTFQITGDSGRKSSSISSREKKTIPRNLAQQINNSKNYVSLCELLAY